MKIDIFLVCSKCSVKHRNYRTSKPKNTQTKKIILRKYCKFCRLTQIHTEESIK